MKTGIDLLTERVRLFVGIMMIVNADDLGPWAGLLWVLLGGVLIIQDGLQGWLLEKRVAEKEGTT